MCSFFFTSSFGGLEVNSKQKNGENESRNQVVEKWKFKTQTAMSTNTKKIAPTFLWALMTLLESSTSSPTHPWRAVIFQTKKKWKLTIWSNIVHEQWIACNFWRCLTLHKWPGSPKNQVACWSCLSIKRNLQKCGLYRLIANFTALKWALDLP